MLSLLAFATTQALSRPEFLTAHRYAPRELTVLSGLIADNLVYGTIEGADNAVVTGISSRGRLLRDELQAEQNTSRWQTKARAICLFDHSRSRQVLNLVGENLH